MKHLTRIFLRAALLCAVLGAALFFLPQPAQAKVKLSKTKVNVEKGKSITLKLSGTSKKSKWSVSDKSVISIKKVTAKKYRVTALKEGTAKVTVKVKKKSYTCTVSVWDPDKRNRIYSGNEDVDYLMKWISEDAKISEDMSDEEIAHGIYKWMAKNCVYEYEATLKYGSSAKTKYPPYGLKIRYDLSKKAAEIAAYKEECDALEAAGEISYSMDQVKSQGRRLYVQDGDHYGTTLELYQRLSGTCSYMSSMYTLLCQRMGLRAGQNAGEIYGSSEKDFVEHYFSWVYISGKKYYVDPGSAVHQYTRRKKFNDTYYKLSKSFRKKYYRLGTEF